MSLFRKASKVARNLFGKGGTADVGFRKISSGLDRAGGLLNQAGNVGNQIANVAGKVLSNPAVQGVGALLAPEFALPAFAAASLGQTVLKSASKGAKLAGQGLKTASDISDPRSYQGSTLQNLQDAKRRIDATTQDMPDFA